MKKMLNPNTTIVFIDAEDVVDPKALTTTILNGATAHNLSCAIVRGYTLNPTDSDTDDSASICDSGNVENRLYDNYEGEFTFFREGDPADADSVYAKAFEYFKEPDRQFYAVRRVGKPNTAAWVAADEYEAFLFTNDRLRSIDGGDDGPIQFTVPMLQQGNYTGYCAVAASGG